MCFNFLNLSGVPAGTTSLCIGFSLGIIFSIVANKKEVDKLKDLLKQTENLVQDLQDELELRDSLTVKELASENYESLDTHNNSMHGTACSIFSTEQCVENPTKYSGKDTCIERASMNPDSMTRIEAELEAELERLGLDIKASNLERRLSDAEVILICGTSLFLYQKLQFGNWEFLLFLQLVSTLYFTINVSAWLYENLNFLKSF